MAGSIWVGTIELAETGKTVTGVSGPPRSDHVGARVLAKFHGAPVGYVEVPLEPAETLSDRATRAAESALAKTLLWHKRMDAIAGNGAGQPDWITRVACPTHFAEQDGTGISVIVCTRDRPETLRDCLRALQAIRYQPVEILVVDNAPSANTTREIVCELGRSDPRIRYTCEPRPGLSMARNHGLAMAKYELLAFTDDDVVVEPAWLIALAAGFAADPEVACVTGPVASWSLDTAAERYFDSRYPWAGALSPRLYDLTTHRDESRLYPFKAGLFGTGANFAVRRTIVSKLGGFDPILGAGGPGKGGEDLDIFLRIILTGHRLCYLPSALVWHRNRTDDAALSDQVYAYGHGLGAYIAKRLLTREIPVTVLAPSVGQIFVIADHARQAAHASELKAHGRRLAAIEAWGVLVGALAFYRAARKTRGSAKLNEVPAAELPSSAE